MRLFNPDIRPPETSELLAAFAALLRDSSDLSGLMPDGVPVYEGDEAVPGEDEAGSGGEWLRLIVREPVIPYGAPLSPSLERAAPVEVVVEASRQGPAGWQPRTMLAAAHSAAYAALVGAMLGTLAYAVHKGCIWCDTPASAPGYDADSRALYSRAVYRLHLAPVVG